MTLSRRNFVGGAAAAIPFSAWIRNAEAAGQTFVRYEARSPQGQAMLQKYQIAVGNMKKLAPTLPTSWQYQWYTHMTPSNKARLIGEVYKTDMKYKPLAQQMWSTCQAHSAGDEENFFLPWHRMFVYFFERIVRKQSGDPAFALPYWNYAVSGPSHGIIPDEFGNKNKTSSLFDGKRNVDSATQGTAAVNAYAPIDKYQPGALSLDALSQKSYEPNGALPGFCGDLDNTIHGEVHVLVGAGHNMGSVPTAAQDPVFWMHHCNIDRLWESWNVNFKGVNPSDSAYLNKTFIFSDENNTKVVATVKDFLSISKLGYSYAALEPAPAGFKALPTVTSASTKLAMPAASDSRTQVALGGKPVSVALAPAKAGAEKFAVRMAKVTAQNVYLVIRDLQTDVQPGTLYAVYLNLPQNAANKEKYRVGTINFFAAMNHAEGVHSAGKFFSFDITAAVRGQGASAIGDTAQVSIAPLGAPVAEAKPVIGEISIVQQ